MRVFCDSNIIISEEFTLSVNEISDLQFFENNKIPRAMKVCEVPELSVGVGIQQ